jgi:ABC-type antimicrobial peptide transport system permease subunit
VGQHIKAPSMEAYYNGGTADWITVVGVVGDVRHYGFEADPLPELFVLYRQMPHWAGFMSAVVKLRPGAPALMLETLTGTTRRLDGRLAVESGPLTARVHAYLAQRRLILGVLGVFAGAALLLVCLGIYGLVSFAVAQRTREIAIRAALGAARGGLLRLMLGSALRVVLAGAAVGLAAAVALRGVLAAMVVDVATTDPTTYAAAAALMVLVALAAALVPALRAARLDPLDALREE